MARVNVGIHPKYLADQHLIAESVELTMITGSLAKNGNAIKGKVPTNFKLGSGHINFFKNKLTYLDLRLTAVNLEMLERGFNPTTEIKLEAFPEDLCNEWTPSTTDMEIVQQRVSERLITRTNGKSGQGFYRYRSKPIENIEEFIQKMFNQKKVYEV
jgi:deoxyribonuclease (pyrimidine dimer)